VASVEIRRDGVYRKDANTRWQKVVQGALQVRTGNSRRERKGGNLAQRVNPRVGSARALGKDSLSRDMVQSLNESALNRGQAGLNLPAMIAGTVVGNRELPVRHGTNWTVTRKRGAEERA
jgi:hypothetical protein